MRDEVQMRTRNTLAFTSGEERSGLHNKNMWRRQMVPMMLHLHALEDRSHCMISAVLQTGWH